MPHAHATAVDRPTRRAFLTARGRTPRASDYWIRVHRRAMACTFEITLASEDAGWVPAARAALNDIDRIEAVLSVFQETSAVSDVNRRAAAEAVVVDDQLFAVLQQCAEIHGHTGGAFDITSTPLSRCWGFMRREGRLPSPAEIAVARGDIGANAVRLDPVRRSVAFDRAGIELNLGAIGKGHALDRVAIEMRRSGVAHALLSAGRSSLLAVGGHDSGWQVEVVSPGVQAALATVWLRDAALGTSGAGQQFVDIDGERYGHVIDPRTGWPARGVLSASVIAPSAAYADALSTAFLVSGIELAERYCAEHAGIMALVTPDDGSHEPLIFGRHPGARVLTERKRSR
jgi:thiamine biosynthesis lipoprotein